MPDPKNETYVVNVAVEVVGPPGYSETARKIVHAIAAEYLINDDTEVRDGVMHINALSSTVEKVR